eukprot:CAMPEP_0119356734 /NCGR_PEP_ID=MMETSP1334-20130426/5265_1 /TAXON_ID=127549 /ORGANISM="Calcidiscus leptoporus, Strain RCC1130" /LENGTH=93 /DNA_ID=CAMNT_0007370827 /DNA_START=94 /DNA_END=375 /DNA_ORIENTATION=+
MHRVLFVFAALLCVANCLVQSAALKAPARSVPVSRAVAPNMVIEESQLVLTTVNTIGTAVASAAGDFGGYTIPIIGLGVLAATIGILAGPVED